MGVNITTIDYLRVLIIEIGSTIILMVVEAQGTVFRFESDVAYTQFTLIIAMLSMRLGGSVLPWKRGHWLGRGFWTLKKRHGKLEI